MQTIIDIFDNVLEETNSIGWEQLQTVHNTTSTFACFARFTYFRCGITHSYCAVFSHVVAFLHPMWARMYSGLNVTHETVQAYKDLHIFYQNS